MIEDSCQAIQSGISHVISFSTDEEVNLIVLKIFQSFTVLTGVLEMVSPRDTLTHALCSLCFQQPDGEQQSVLTEKNFQVR